MAVEETVPRTRKGQRCCFRSRARQPPVYLPEQTLFSLLLFWAFGFLALCFGAPGPPEKEWWVDL